MSDNNLLSRLPAVRGRLREAVPLAPHTWFRVGGMAEVLFKPADEQDLSDFLKHCPADIPVQVIGVASNLIVRDGGLRGVTIKLGGEFAKIEARNETREASENLPAHPNPPPQGGREQWVSHGPNGSPPLAEGVRGGGIIVGAAALDTTVAQYAAAEGLGGLEFLSGIPGTIGGALRMNAGAYGTEIKDVLHRATAIDRSGRFHTVSADDLHMTYRHCGAPPDWIFTGAILRGTPDSAENIAARMEAIKSKREASQPVRARTGGSTFANPDGLKAWALIDAAGCRGLRLGGAMVSDLHCNFLLNMGDATASDLEQLGEMVRARVLAHSGIDLRWEIQRIGLATSPSQQVAA